MGWNEQMNGVNATVPNRRLAVAGGSAIIGLAVLVRAFVSAPVGVSADTVPGDTLPPVSLATLTQARADRGALMTMDWPYAPGRDPFAAEHLIPAPRAAEVAAPIPQGETWSVDDVVREALSRISLHGTMLGEQPTAMINGNLHREGDQVEGFTIQRIEAKRIIIERKGVRLAIPVTR